MKALVTGNAGFVGRHLHSALASQGHEVVGVDPKYGTDAMDFFRGPSTFMTGLPKFDAVFHCAAFVLGRSGIDGAPAHLHTYNTMLDAAMFQWAMHNDVGHIVYYSSSAAYCIWDQINSDHMDVADAWEPLTEDFIDVGAPGLTETAYGLTKLHGEQMVHDVRRYIPTTVFRPFSGYGHDQGPEYPFPAFVGRAQAREDPFTIWGDGQQLRDWVHIDDIVEVSLLAAEEGINDTLNICTGRGTNFIELADIITKEAGYSPEYEHILDAPAGVPYRVGDPTRLNRYYTPKVSLEEGVRRAFDS